MTIPTNYIAFVPIPFSTSPTQTKPPSAARLFVICRAVGWSWWLAGLPVLPPLGSVDAHIIQAQFYRQTHMLYARNAAHVRESPRLLSSAESS